MDLRPFYFNALDNTGRIVSGVSATQLSGDTPCGDWDVRALLQHMVGGVDRMMRVLDGESLTPQAEMPDLLGDDPGTAYKTVSAKAVEAWNQEDALERTVNFRGEMPSTMLLRIALMEAVVHGWDLAKATGQEHGIEPMVAAAMLSGLQQTITDETRTGIFEPAVPISADAPVEQQLVAFLGREP